MTIFASDFLLNSMATKFYNDVAKAKLIVNGLSVDTTIEKKEIIEKKVRIHVKFIVGASDVFNGVEFYDSSDNLLIRDELNLNFAVQGATYIYECSLFAEKVI